jgi:NADPH:quinone reductase
MRAVILEECGPAENLKLVEVPVPTLGDGEVLIKTEAASVGYPDVMMRKGEYVKQINNFPYIPGREVAGTIEKVGSGVMGVKPSMRVAARLLTGGYAEYATAPVKNLVFLPDRVSSLQGLVYLVNLPLAYLVYYFCGRVGPRATILLHAPAGGVGTLITQIAKRRAHNVVIALSSSQEKLDYCFANGADYGVNYKAGDYVEEVLRLTGGKGVDVSLNSVSGPTLEKDPLVIKPLGRWVIYGSSAGYREIDPRGTIVLKSLTIVHFSVYSVIDREEFRQAKEFLDHWLHTEDLISVSKTFPIEEAVTAHRWIEEQRNIGKIALVM